MNQVRLVKMGTEEVGLVVVRVAWVVGERRGLELALLVDGRGWERVMLMLMRMRMGIHQVYQHLVLHLLKRVQIHLQILPLLLHHLNTFQWNLKLQRCHHRHHIRKPNQPNQSRTG